MPARHAHQMTLHPRHPRYSEHAQDTQQARPATPFEIACARASLLTPAEHTGQAAPSHQAFAAFKAGQGTIEHWRELVDALNISEALAQRHRIAPDHLSTILAGQNALAAVYARQLTSWTLRGTEIAALTEALFIWRVQLDFVSRGDLLSARTYVHRRNVQVQRTANPQGARIVGIEPPAATGAPA